MLLMHFSANLLLFHLFVLVIVDAPLAGTSVALAQADPLDDLLAGSLEVVGPAYRSKKVDEGRGQVQAIAWKLGCLVVPGESVMVVVPTLAQSEKGHARVFHCSEFPVDSLNK